MEENNNNMNNNVNNGVNPNMNNGANPNVNNTPNNNVSYNMNGEFSVDFNKDELKQQTKDTFDQVKNTFKNTDFQSGANEAKGFVKNFISHPISTIDEVINEKVNYFSTAIILIVCFMISAAANSLLGSLLSKYSSIYLKSVVLLVISPIVYILAFTISTYLLMGKNKKSIPTIITGFSISCISFTLINIIEMIETVVSKALSIGFIFRMFTSSLSLAAHGLMFYFITELVKSEEGKDKGFRKAVIIVFVSFAIIYIAGRLGIYSGI